MISRINITIIHEDDGFICHDASIVMVPFTDAAKMYNRIQNCLIMYICELYQQRNNNNSYLCPRLVCDYSADKYSSRDDNIRVRVISTDLNMITFIRCVILFLFIR